MLKFFIMVNQKTVYRIILAVVVSAFIFVACNNKSDEKGASKDTTTNTMNTMSADSSGMKKMDTGMNKMDTAGTRPVKPGD
jgi:PBP1b-binding outer membrane lipoprotein LpoB